MKFITGDTRQDAIVMALSRKRREGWRRRLLSLARRGAHRRLLKEMWREVCGTDGLVRMSTTWSGERFAQAFEKRLKALEHKTDRPLVYFASRPRALQGTPDQERMADALTTR